MSSNERPPIADLPPANPLDNLAPELKVVFNALLADIALIKNKVETILTSREFTHKMLEQLITLDTFNGLVEKTVSDTFQRFTGDVTPEDTRPKVMDYRVNLTVEKVDFAEVQVVFTDPDHPVMIDAKTGEVLLSNPFLESCIQREILTRDLKSGRYWMTLETITDKPLDETSVPLEHTAPTPVDDVLPVAEPPVVEPPVPETVEAASDTGDIPTVEQNAKEFSHPMLNHLPDRIYLTPFHENVFIDNNVPVPKPKLVPSVKSDDLSGAWLNEKALNFYTPWGVEQGRAFQAGRIYNLLTYTNHPIFYQLGYDKLLGISSTIIVTGVLLYSRSQNAMLYLDMTPSVTPLDFNDEQATVTDNGHSYNNLHTTIKANNSSARRADIEVLHKYTSSVSAEKLTKIFNHSLKWEFEIPVDSVFSFTDKDFTMLPTDKVVWSGSSEFTTALEEAGFTDFTMVGYTLTVCRITQ